MNDNLNKNKWDKKELEKFKNIIQKKRKKVLDELTEAKNKADEVWSLSKMTLPHNLVRIVIIEQIYRAWSIINRHPYHRE